MAVAPGPLDGIVVVDFSRIVSGPFATQILGDLRANVIKIEQLGIGDEVRSYGVTDPARMPGPTFLAMNRNKQSIALDVRTPAGHDVARRLLRTADVALHNFRTGVMERLGLGFDAIAADNPGIVYCSISGFGAEGPLRDAPANDLSIQAHTGLLSITGEPGGAPVRNPAPVCDMTAGLYAVIGILAALQRRHLTGRGQHVETNMYEGQINLLNYMFVDYWLNGIVPEKMGTANRMGLPNQAFPTSDGWICLVAASEPMWVRCCEALGVPGLADDPRFRTLADRYRHRAELDVELAAATRRHTTAAALELLEAARIPCSPVNTFPEVAAHPQFQALADGGLTVEMPVAALGDVRLVMSPIHFSESPVRARRPPPALGQDTDGLLAEMGYSASEIAALRSDGVVG